jgi:hypothetical protein
MLFRPYYLIQAYSKNANKQTTEWLTHELDLKKRCANLQEARERSKQWAAAEREAKRYGYSDWEPIVRLVTDNGSYLVSEDQ